MTSKHQTPNPKPRCHRHPNDVPITTGLCASCLHHRLSLLNPDQPSTSTSAALPELRRCKTSSVNNSHVIVASPSLEDSVTGLLCRTNCDFEVARVSDLPVIVDDFEESKTMKEFIDLEIQANTKATNTKKDCKEIPDTFWVGASVFSKKLQKWRMKQGSTTAGGSNGEQAKCEKQLKKLRGRKLKFRERYSEIGEYAFGRRSCDTNPRFSGRASLDAPRASWDGYFMEGNGMTTVYGFDNGMLYGVKMKFKNKDEKGFDRSSSLKTNMGVIKDGKAKPIGLYNGTKLLITEKELNEWRLNSLKNVDNDVEIASKDIAHISSVSTRKDVKTWRQWGKVPSIWDLVHRTKGDKYDNQEKPKRQNVECP